ncbi:hypothetical protein DCCM_1025 [Desulfocucumis palustris]|uniref:Uncharacterized protein n=1 Tax=Desulfocucumis palustris TaxID=1898651 RepID=A0A2L2X9C0_9FIRM|nr:hypothetical protein [Desulfocucumis palustris]GBF32829.1 hypothetical protein DCCM_1025 [Desulfocucumis palustris]
MADNDLAGTSLEKTLFQLLQNDSVKNMDTGNLLVLISLVNLMGLVDIINRRTGGEQMTAAEGEHRGNVPDNQAKEEGGGGAALNPAALMGMLNQMMKPRPRASSGVPGEERDNQQPEDDK